FGQGLYFGIGAYAAALLSHHWYIGDAAAMLLAGALSAGLAAFLFWVFFSGFPRIFFSILLLPFLLVFFCIVVEVAAPLQHGRIQSPCPRVPRVRAGTRCGTARLPLRGRRKRRRCFPPGAYALGRALGAPCHRDPRQRTARLLSGRFPVSGRVPQLPDCGRP